METSKIINKKKFLFYALAIFGFLFALIPFPLFLLGSLLIVGGPLITPFRLFFGAIGIYFLVKAFRQPFYTEQGISTSFDIKKGTRYVFYFLIISISVIVFYYFYIEF